MGRTGSSGSSTTTLRSASTSAPTLLAWLEVHRPEVYGAVLEADRQSAERFGGHGSAIAQPYNHTILPLSNSRDKQTQIHWGLRDFERRFGRRAEGVWLPEAAVDLESLDLLAVEGIRFTILAPERVPCQGRTDSLTLTLPPLGMLLLKRDATADVDDLSLPGPEEVVEPALPEVIVGAGEEPDVRDKIRR